MDTHVSGNSETTTEEYMSIFWALFQLHPIDDEVEYLVIKHFSTTLHDAAKILYDSLPNKVTETMEHLKRPS
jgi:hypothetical protein